MIELPYPEVFPWAPADAVLGDLVRIENEWNTIKGGRQPPQTELRERYAAALDRVRLVEMEILSARIDQWIARGQVDNALVRRRQDLQNIAANLGAQLP